MKTTPKSALETTHDLFARLRKRERGGELFLFEVGDGAGFSNRGWSDAISMQTWPSKKLVVRGYEVKATRSDWLRELDNPHKNEKWQAQCHEWYVVAAKDVVRLEELPPAWGLLVPKGRDQLRIASRAETKTGDDRVPLGLMAAVFRAAAHGRQALENQESRRIEAVIEKRYGERVEQAERRAQEAETKYRELANALGSTWEGLPALKKRAEAIRELQDERHDATKLVQQAKQNHERIAGVLGELEQSLRAE